MKQPTLRPIITATFLSLIGFGMMVPLLPLFARQFGAGGFVVGLLMGANQVVDFFFAPIAGHLSDRVGRRSLLLFAYGITAAAYLGVGFAGSEVVLGVIWMVAGFGSSQILLTQAYIADVTSDEDRTRGMGLWGAGFAVGFVVGPPLGAMLFDRNPLIAASVAAGFSLLALLQTALFVCEPQRHHAEITPKVSFLKEFRGVVLAVIALCFVSVFVWSKVTTMLALYTQDEFSWGVREYGMYLGFVGLASALMQGWMIGPLARRYGRRRLVVAGFALMGGGLLLLVSLPSGWSQAFSAVPMAFGFGILTPTLPAVLSSEVHPSRKGRALGVFQSASTLARVIAPILAGLLYDRIGHPAPFIAAAIVSLLASLMVLVLPWKK
ncbi:MAG: MFS transporter [bacterium]